MFLSTSVVVNKTPLVKVVKENAHEIAIRLGETLADLGVRVDFIAGTGDWELFSKDVFKKKAFEGGLLVLIIHAMQTDMGRFGDYLTATKVCGITVILDKSNKWVKEDFEGLVKVIEGNALTYDSKTRTIVLPSTDGFLWDYKWWTRNLRLPYCPLS